MADDTLRLVAKVTDEFTGPLGRLKAGLKGVSDETSKHGALWKKDWAQARGEVEKFQGVLGGFSPILSAVGVGSLGASLSIGGMVAALKGFSGSTRELSLMAKDIGLTVDQLRAFGGLGEKFGVTADTMRGAAKNFSDEMRNIRQHGSEYVQLQAHNLGKLAEDLASSKNMEEAIERGLEGLKNIPDPVLRRRIARMLFGTDDIGLIASNLTGTAREALQKVQTEIGHLDKETEAAAKRFEDSFSRVGNAFEKLKLGVLGPALKGAADAMNEFADASEKLGSGKWIDALKAIDRGSDMGLGPRKNAPASQAPSDLDEQLDAQMRGQVPQTKDQKERANQVQAIERRLADRKAELEYQQHRFPLKDEGAIRSLTDEIRKMSEELRRAREQGASVSPSNFGGFGAGGGSLIQKAAWGGSNFGGGGAVTRMNGGGSSFPRSESGSSVGRPGSTHDAPAASGNGSAAIPAPRGDGTGNPRAARMGQMMAHAMDQLRREGVPEERLREAAAHLVGQAHMESGLDPNKVHDGGTGYGIYGARDPSPGRGRRSDMLRWLAENGYARNSAEGQMRYMAREAMSGKYPKTRSVLMGRGTGDVDADTNTITGEFERPAIINRRSGAVRRAMQVGPDQEESPTAGSVGGSTAGLDGQEGVDLGNGKMRMPNGRIRSKTFGPPGRQSTSSTGDQLMDRFFGRGAPGAGPTMQMPGGGGGKGTLHIKVEGPEGTQVRHELGGLFRETSVTRGRSQMDMERA